VVECGASTVYRVAPGGSWKRACRAALSARSRPVAAVSQLDGAQEARLVALAVAPPGRASETRPMAAAGRPPTWSVGRRDSISPEMRAHEH